MCGAPLRPPDPEGPEQRPRGGSQRLKEDAVPGRSHEHKHTVRNAAELRNENAAAECRKSEK